MNLRERAGVGLASVAVVLGAASALVVFPGVVMPFLAGKSVVLAGAAVLACTSVLCLENGPASPRRSWISAALIFLSVAATVSTLTSPDPTRSLWDSLERQTGLVALLQVGAIYVALVVAPLTASTWRKINWSVLAVISATSAIAVAQLAFPGLLEQANQGTRLGSTLGHPALLGGVAIYGTGLAAVAAVGARGRSLALAGALGVLNIVGVALSDTRSATLGLTVLVVSATWVWTRHRRAQQKRSLAIRLSAVGLLVGAAAALAAGVHVPGLSRFSEVLAGAASMQTRLTMWRASMHAVGDAPFFGWGLGSFPLALDKYFPPSIVLQGSAEAWWSDAHSVVITTLVEEGLLGFLALGALITAVAATAAQALRNRDLECGLAGATLLGVFVHDLFIYESHASYVLAALLLAFMDSRPSAPALANPVARSQYRLKARARVLLASLAVLVFVVIATATVRGLMAARRTSVVLDAIHNGDDTHAQGELRDSSGLASWHARERLQLGAVSALARLSTPGRTDLARDLDILLYLDSELAREVKAAPRDLRIKLARIQLLRAAARAGAPLRIDDALALAEDAARLSPRRQDVLFELGSLQLESGDARHGLATLEQAVVLEPRYGAAWWRLALARERLGDHAGASATATQGLASATFIDAAARYWLTKLSGR